MTWSMEKNKGNMRKKKDMNKRDVFSGGWISSWKCYKVLMEQSFYRNSVGF